MKDPNHDVYGILRRTVHDLKNPLTLVFGHIQLLKKRYANALDENFRISIGEIEAGSLIMQNLLDSLHLYARVHSIEPDVTQIDMAQIVSDALGQIGTTIRASGASIIQPAEWPAAIGYGDWVREVWVACLQNALQRSTRISLGASQESEYVRYWVDDTGSPLNSEQINDIFSPLSKRTGALGLSMYTAQYMVEKLGGSIALEGLDGVSGPAQYGGNRLAFTLRGCG